MIKKKQCFKIYFKIISTTALTLFEFWKSLPIYYNYLLKMIWIFYGKKIVFCQNIHIVIVIPKTNFGICFIH